MPNITIQSTHGSTITPFLSAFGPNITKEYDALTLSTSTSGITATITDCHFLNTPRYSNQNLFTFTPLSLSALPVTISSLATKTIGLSASVAECSVGVRAGTLVLTLSSMALSAAALSSTPVPFAVDNTTQTLSFPLTAKNLPYHGHLCKRRYHRMRASGGF